MNPTKSNRTSSLSIERFIEEIKRRPELWDTKCTGYGDKNRKTDAWDELYDIFIKGWEEMSPDERFVQARGLQRRWKSLRDCFRRELKLKSSSANASTRRPYLFYKQLKFLLPFTDTKDLDNTVLPEPSENDDAEDTKYFEEVYVESTTISPVPEERRPQKNSETSLVIPSSSQAFEPQVTLGNKAQTFENQLLGILSKSMEMRAPNLMNTDEDQLFLLSLAGELRKVPEERKLMLKSEIINCILRAQQTSVNADGFYTSHSN